jgi:hypothetical protein
VESAAPHRIDVFIMVLACFAEVNFHRTVATLTNRFIIPGPARQKVAVAAKPVYDGATPAHHSQVELLLQLLQSPRRTLMGQHAPRMVVSACCAGLVVALLISSAARAQQVSVVSQGASHKAAHRSVLINMVPHVAARPSFAGEACAAMYLERLGTGMDQDFVFEQSGIDPAHGRGCTIGELKLALERIGFLVGQVWYPISSTKPDDDLSAQFNALHADLDSGVPTIVEMRDSEKASAPKRFRLVLGYDADSDEILYHEPLEKEGAFKRMDRATLLKLWPLKSGRDWTVARMPLKSDEKLNYVGPSSADLLTDADFAQHVRKLKPLLPEDYHVFVQRPFVVVGNDIEGVVRTHANETVKWAVDRLKLMYFEQDPDHIIIVWLMKDERSYNEVIGRYYKHQPASKFGYYSPGHKAIFANMSYGTGTLVHEIVHPFMLANFPKCPSWFNEGLASLYEQSNDRDGRMLAQTNQRLAQVQKAIMARQMTPLATLTSTSREDFYVGRDRLMNYAAARYLCYYLEKHDLLGTFYHEFRANVDDDPTGYKSLQKVLGEDGHDMARFQRKWENWLLMRRY